jgi:hypothetical protein
LVEAERQARLSARGEAQVLDAEAVDLGLQVIPDELAAVIMAESRFSAPRRSSTKRPCSHG